MLNLYFSATDIRLYVNYVVLFSVSFEEIVGKQNICRIYS